MQRKLELLKTQPTPKAVVEHAYADKDSTEELEKEMIEVN
jgi:hypothetical protein